MGVSTPVQLLASIVVNMKNAKNPQNVLENILERIPENFPENVPENVPENTLEI